MRTPSYLPKIISIDLEFLAIVFLNIHGRAHTTTNILGNFLACVPGVHGGASAYMAACKLGHSVDVAESHYLGVIPDLSPRARTLAVALNVESAPKEIIRNAGVRHEHRKVAAGGPHIDASDRIIDSNC